MGRHDNDKSPTTKRVIVIVLLWILRLWISYSVWQRTHSYLHQIYIYIVFWLALGSFGVYEVFNWYRSRHDKKDTISKALLRIENTF